jgi:general secretion pathway protein A
VEDLDAALKELQWVEFASTTNRMKAMADADRTGSHPSSISTPQAVVGRILLASEGKTVVERELRPGRLVIGRTPDNDLQIDSKFISRHHCQIVTQADSCLIEDLNSTNGIYVQSKRVRRHNLNDGDVVQVGQHEIMYIDERAPRVRHATEHAETAVLDTPKSG